VAEGTAENGRNQQARGLVIYSNDSFSDIHASTVNGSSRQRPYLLQLFLCDYELIKLGR
jgi:hypothetical protein